MRTVMDSLLPDKTSPAMPQPTPIRPTDIQAFHTRPLPGAWNRKESYAVTVASTDTADSRVVEISVAEWRALLQSVMRLTDRRTVHRHMGIDLLCEGLLIEVVS